MKIYSRIKKNKSLKKQKTLKKQNNHNKQTQKLIKINKSHKNGGGLLGKIGSSMVRYTKPMSEKNHIKKPQGSLPGLSFLNRVIKNSSIASNIKSNYQVILNYHSDNQVNVAGQTISSYKLSDKEPKIIINDNNRYLVAICNITSNELLWLAEYKNGFKIKTIIPYIKLIPKTTISTITLNFQFYIYPENIIPFTPTTINNLSHISNKIFTGIKRTNEFKNFITYLANPAVQGKVSLKANKFLYVKPQSDGDFQSKSKLPFQF